MRTLKHASAAVYRQGKRIKKLAFSTTCKTFFVYSVFIGQQTRFDDG